MKKVDKRRWYQNKGRNREKKLSNEKDKGGYLQNKSLQYKEENKNIKRWEERVKKMKQLG